MTSNELRKKFLDFFEKNGHKIVPSSSLIPDDPSVLLTTAGMQQFKKYYTGEADPIRDFGTKSTASCQKSFRTSDIDEVGDESHLTFFEMLGNFSFGGYFKEEAIKYAYNFFKEINLPIEYVTVFGGDKEVPLDEESARIWRGLGMTKIEKRGREDNFWGPTGEEGPCGPTTEIYMQGTEIWNIVFNEYYCQPDKTLEKLKQNGVDTGMGLERLAMVMQGKKNIFETDLFMPFIELFPAGVPLREKRIIADHFRGASFLLADGVRPSNKERGYVLRRLMRRMMVYQYISRIPADVMMRSFEALFSGYGGAYSELLRERENIQKEFSQEGEKFSKTLVQGMKALERARSHGAIDAAKAFIIYETFGLPFEIIKELGSGKTAGLTREAFDEEFKKHQEISRAGAVAKFGGHGLYLKTGEVTVRDKSELEKVTRLHTATHLLHAALRTVLGLEVQQDGSDITVDRTRFDFKFPRKLTSEEIKKVEHWVQDKIRRNLTVKQEEMSYEEALSSGALAFFREKYPPRVKVYTFYDSKTREEFSKELCGGPHVENTAQVGDFRIVKEEAVGAGTRRIRAVVVE
jgi:alanyl-tRNA synthetase